MNLAYASEDRQEIAIRKTRQNMVAKFIEKIKLEYRAYGYRAKNDVGGYKYLNSVVKRGQQVLDIGAHKGGYTYAILKKIGPQGSLYAFEPQSSLYVYLSSLKSKFNWSNVMIEHLALSDEEGTALLYIPHNKIKQSSSPAATLIQNASNTEFNQIEEIQTTTLDSYCTRLNIKPDFLKIDIEGNELNALKGGDAILKLFKPNILIEIESRHVGEERARLTFEYLRSLGYKGRFIQGSKYRPIEEFSFEKHQNSPGTNTYCNNFIFE